MIAQNFSHCLIVAFTQWHWTILWWNLARTIAMSCDFFLSLSPFRVFTTNCVHIWLRLLFLPHIFFYSCLFCFLSLKRMCGVRRKTKWIKTALKGHIVNEFFTKAFHFYCWLWELFAFLFCAVKFFNFKKFSTVYGWQIWKLGRK